MDSAKGGAPYRDLAQMYDELVGFAAFDCWRENFDRLVNRNGTQFSIAADIACGTGLAAEYLSRRCSKVYAADASREMLEVAKRRCDGRRVEFLLQSFTELDLPRRADLLTCNFDSLNYLRTEGELREALRRFRASLNGGGATIFDMNTARELGQGLGEAVLVHRTGAGISIWESAWNEGERTNTVQMTNFLKQEDGLFRMSVEVHVERCYDLDTIAACLHDAGFSRFEAYDARDLAVVGPDTRRVQFLACA